MFSYLCKKVPRTDQAAANPTVYHGGAVQNEFNKNGYLTTQTLPPRTGRPDPFYPPAHRHVLQQEYFEVMAGRGRWHLLDTKTSIDLAAGDKITIERWQPHTFENLSSTEPLVIGARYDKARWDLERQERFFRNTLGHVDDSLKAGTTPSVFQLSLFLHEADMTVAVFPGPESIAKWADWAFTAVMGRCIGQWLLGYRGSYREYCLDAPKKTN